MSYSIITPSSIPPVAALICIEPNGQRRQHYFYEDTTKYVIGRCEGSFITLTNPIISRSHCIIEKTPDYTFTIHDVSSSGVFLNGEKLIKNKAYELCHQDKINLAQPDGPLYTFMFNKSFKTYKKQREKINSRMKEEMFSLNNSQCEEIKKLNQEMQQMLTEKSEIKLVMDSQIKEQKNMFREQQLALSIQAATSKKKKEEAEKKLMEIEKSGKAEKDKLIKELENKITIINKKEEELQMVKGQMEKRHQNERQKLEDRCKEEIGNLKEKLAECELEQERLNGKTKIVEEKLEETKKTLQDCEMEQHRLYEEKVAVETKLETKIIDLTQESTNKDEIVKDLEKRLQDKEEEEALRRQEMEGLEEHLQCSICVELFIEPVVLNCGHMFCNSCIEEWKTRKKICPMCRSKITTAVRIFTLDAIIEKNVALLSTKSKERRDNMIQERQKVTQTPPNKKRKHGRGGSSANRRNARISANAQQIIPMTRIPTSNIHNLNQHNPDVHVLLSDPFSWHVPDPRPQTSGGWTRPSESLVSVAAIDLTNIPIPPLVMMRTPRVRNAASTSTSTSGGALIDLTTP